MTLALERTAHAQSARIDIAPMVETLQHVLGQRLTAMVADVSDAKAVGKWARGERTPQPESEQRLRNAFHVAQLLLQREAPSTVRAWFMGMNPDLDDRAPALVIGEDPTRVMQAARAFLANG